MQRILFSLFVLATVTFVQAQTVPVSTDSDAARSHFELGVHALTNADFAKGRMHLDAALEADPDFALAHMYRASISPADKRDMHMKQAMEHADDISEGERMMIASYEASLEEDYDRELELLGDLAERYPDDPLPPFMMGWRYYNQERYDDAKASAMRSLEADAEFAGAYNMLGYIELNQEDYAASEAAFKNYVRLAPDEANPYDSLGELYLNMARYDEAAEQFEMALERDPEFTVSRNNLVRAGIEMVNLKFEAAVANQDADALTALYTENGQLLPPGGPVVEGHDAIRDFWSGVFASGVDGADLVTDEVYTMGTTATEIGAAMIKVGDQVVDESKYTVVWVKDGDTWKLHRDIWNSSNPPATTAAADN